MDSRILSLGNYYVVQLILDKGLHTENDDTMTYTTTLMDKLEKFKSENQNDDVIHDDMAAQAYVEQFAMETFQRGENTVHASKVTL
jgi:vacuolar protein sorting-associated protein VTA1